MSYNTIAPSSGHSPFLRASNSNSYNPNPYPSSSSSNSYNNNNGGSSSNNNSIGSSRGQTLEEMYSAPENTLEIEVRDPKTYG